LGWALVAGWALLWPSLADARDYLNDARQALQKGDLKAAQIQLRNAVREDPQNAEAHFQLARVNLQLGDPVAAEKEASAARDRGYDKHKVVPVLAQAYMAQSKYQDLLRDFTVDHKDAALDAQVLVARGYAQAALRDLAGAANSFAEAERLAPEALEPLTAQFRLAIAKGDLDTAQAKMERALSLQPKNQEALLEKAQLLHRKGDLPGALAAADELISVAPAFPDGRLERATLLVAMGKDDKAKADLAAVFAALPNNPKGLLLQALLESRRKDFKAADATLQKISSVMPNLPRGYFLQAFVKAQLGEWEQAEDAAQRYVARVPDDLAGLKLLAGIEMQRQRPDKVIEVLAKPAAAGVADAATFDLLGRAYSTSGHQEEAMRAFEKAAALAPDDPQMRGRLAASRLAMGDPNAAVGDLEKALEIAPKQPSIGAALFFAEMATGDLNRAAAAITKIRKVQGDTPVVQNLEGLLKLARLDIDGAKAQFTKITESAPDFTPAKVSLARIAAMQGRPEDALKILDDVLAKNPTSEPALSMVVGTLTSAGKTADAAAMLERARKAAPTDLRLTIGLADLYTRMGDAKKALALLGEDPAKLNNNPALLGAQARARAALGQTAEARDSYMRALAIDPKSLDTRQRLIALLVQANELEAARNVVQEGLRNAPENFRLLNDYIAIDNKAGGIDKALATADRLRSQVSDTPSVRGLKGDVYMSANRFDDAAKEFAAQLKQAPSAYLAMRLTGAQLAGNHPDQGRQTLSDWLAKHPDDLGVAEALAGLEIKQGRYDEAETHLKSILDKKPRDPISLNNLAWIYQQRGDKRARDIAQEAYVLYPSGQTADTLGWVLVKQGDAATALPLLRQASSQLPGNLDIRYHLAAALNDTGQRDEARKLLTGIIEANAKFDEKPNAQKLLDELSKS
jgi:putative PEP-CTERM system TPR-repeat lipoprotein